MAYTICLEFKKFGTVNFGNGKSIRTVVLDIFFQYCVFFDLSKYFYGNIITLTHTCIVFSSYGVVGAKSLK